MRLRNFLLTGAACVFAVGPGAAWAEEPAQQGQAQGSAQGSAHGSTQGQASTSSEGAAQLTEVVVTATKRESRLEKTPIAITAFTQENLSRNQVTDLTEMARFVPTLAYSQQGDQGAINLTMRGIGNDSAFTEVADPEVALYVDGIYSPRAQGATVLMYDMARVEVLRGPQGTLWGRNATVGAIDLVTAKPNFDGFSGYLEAVGGSYDRIGTQGAVNLPLTDDFAVRFAFATEAHDGYAKYQQPPAIPGIDPSAFVTSGKRYYAQDQKSLRLSSEWKPNDRFTWDLSLEGFFDDGAPVIGLMQTPRPGQALWSTLSDTAPQTDRYNYAVRSEMNYKLTDGILLSYIAGAGRVGGSADSDADMGTLPPTSATEPIAGFEENRTTWSHYTAYSHELQLKSAGNQTVDWILGLYYSNEDNAIRFDIDERNGYRDGTFNWAGSFVQQQRTIESEAGFGQATWHITDRIRLTGGLRYTQDTKQDVGGRNITFNGCPTADPNCTAGIFGIAPGATAQQLLAILGPGYAISNNDVKGSWDKLTYLGRLDVDVTDKILGYLSVGTGFKSGNIEDGGKLAGPETLTNYEVGSKIRFWDGRAYLNLAAYYEDFTGYQVNQAVTLRDASGNIISTSLVTQNAKGAKVYGGEAEFSANLTSADHVQLSLGALHSELDQLYSIDARLYAGGDTSHLVNLEGNALPHAPSISGQVMYEHRFDIGPGVLTPRVTTHFESASWLSYFHEGAPDRQNAYTRTDLLLHFQPNDKPWSVEAFVLNVENNNIKATAGAYGAPTYAPVWTAVYQPPMTWGARIRTKF
jgi:iron complex outermembrane receptor protein